MSKTENTIITFLLYREGSIYQFLGLELMLGIGIRSGIVKEAFGIGFVPSIAP